MTAVADLGRVLAVAVRTAAIVAVYAGPYLAGSVWQLVLAGWRDGRADARRLTGEP